MVNNVRVPSALVVFLVDTLSNFINHTFFKVQNLLFLLFNCLNIAYNITCFVFLAVIEPRSPNLIASLFFGNLTAQKFLALFCADSITGGADCSHRKFTVASNKLYQVYRSTLAIRHPLLSDY
jgi:hypothetical protein